MRDDQRSPRSKRSKRDAAPPSPYEMQLDEEDRAIFAAASGDLDLTEEIRLLRTALALLGPDLAGKVREASAALGTLKRLIDTQARLKGSGNEIERALVEAAERALGALTDAEHEGKEDAI